MKKTSFHILRIGFAITFIWVGILIFRQPEAWGGYIMPWAMKLLPVSLDQIMMGTAVLDVLIGILLLLDIFTWLAAFVGATHMIAVLIVSGITDITVRDIAIFAGMVALAIESWPFLEKNKIET